MEADKGERASSNEDADQERKGTEWGRNDKWRKNFEGPNNEKIQNQNWISGRKGVQITH